MAKRYYWFKMKDNFFKAKEMKKLRRIAGGDTFTIIYLKLLMLSVKSEGRLEYDGVEETFADELALELDEEVDNVKLTLQFLHNVKLIEMVSDDEIILKEAMENIGTEVDSAERVRLHRERKSQLALQCNTQVTMCNTEKEKIEREEKEIDIRPYDIQCSDIFKREYFKYYGIEYPRRIKTIVWDRSIIEYMKPYDFVEALIAFFDNYEADDNKCTAEYFNSLIPKYNAGKGF